MDEAEQDRAFQRSKNQACLVFALILAACVTIGSFNAMAQTRAAHHRWGHSIQGRIISQGATTGESGNPYRENSISFTDRRGKDRVVTRLLPWTLPVGAEVKLWADTAGNTFVVEDLQVNGLDPWPITFGTIFWRTFFGLIIGAVVAIAFLGIAVSRYDLESIPDHEQT